MKKTSSARKSAFSLIELSIVLIIIGLLIAGVTGGASLIRSSELRAVISEARGYAVAVNSFYTQFNAYPGDYATSIYTSDTVGDGDNTIEYCSASGLIYEGNLAWQDLETLGGVDTALTYAAGSSSQTFGTNLPSSKIKSAGWGFDYRTTAEGASSTAANQNVVALTATVGTTSSSSNTLVNGTNIATAAIFGADALSIDTKIDDTYATTGKVRGLNIGSATTGCYTAAASDTVAYTVTSTTTKVCALTYQVDVNS